MKKVFVVLVLVMIFHFDYCLSINNPSLQFKYDPPITAQYSMASLKQIFTTLSQYGKINILFDENVPLNKIIVTFNVKDLSFSKTFDVLLNTNDLDAVQISDDTIIVMPSNKLQQYIKSEKRIISLSYLEVVKLIPIIQSVFTDLTRHQTQPLKLISEEKRNLLIVVGPKETIQEIEKLIKEIDQKIPQVMIELKVAEISYQKDTDIGSQLQKYEISSTTLAPYDKYKMLTLNDFPSLIKLLKTVSDAKMLASPNIRVIDKQKAQISITDQIPITISTTQIGSSTTTAGGTPTAYTTTQVQFFDIGIKFVITPTIHPDNEVTIDLNVEITSLGKVTPGNNIPEIGKRAAQTIIRLKNGETNVMSGLKKEEQRITKTQLPIISDIPLIGFVFDVILGSTQTQTIQSEIIMSITPHIIPIK